MTRRKRDPLPRGAWAYATKWPRIVTKDPKRIASFKFEIKYVGGGSTSLENSPRTRREPGDGT